MTPLWTDSQYNQLIKPFMKEGESLQLLYKGTRDGFKAKNFHDLCDGKPNTLCIIKSESGYVFGGCTKSQWLSPQEP
jgi:hypothetical protein